MTRALVMHPGEQHAVLADVDGQDLQALQKLVGGYLEGIPVAGIALALINEEGKLMGLPVNLLATQVMHDLGALHPRDTIVGSLVMVSVAPGGATGDVPDSIVEHVRDGMDVVIEEE